MDNVETQSLLISGRLIRMIHFKPLWNQHHLKKTIHVSESAVDLNASLSGM